MALYKWHSPRICLRVFSAQLQKQKIPFHAFEVRWVLRNGQSLTRSTADTLLLWLGGKKKHKEKGLRTQIYITLKQLSCFFLNGLCRILQYSPHRSNRVRNLNMTTCNTVRKVNDTVLNDQISMEYLVEMIIY